MKHRLKTKLGSMVIEEHGGMLLSVGFNKEMAGSRAGSSLPAAKQLQNYFSGKSSDFTLKLDLHGTPFQLKVWQALRTIPYGKTATYRDIAGKIKNPKAIRAVANAIGANPIAIIIPCHRVIRSDGSIGGYKWGVTLKTQLLQLEASS